MNKQQYRYCMAPPTSHCCVLEYRYNDGTARSLFLFRKGIDRQSRSSQKPCEDVTRKHDQSLEFDKDDVGELQLLPQKRRNVDVGSEVSKPGRKPTMSLSVESCSSIAISCWEIPEISYRANRAV
jgi:hypothetical protein